MSDPKRIRMHTGKGFIAALDQSGGSTPKALRLYGIAEDAYHSDEEMFDLVHEMRTRILTCPSSTVAIMIIVMRYQKFSHAALVKGFTLLCGIAVCLSTVVLKQHSVIDIVLGGLLTLILYKVCMQTDWMKYLRKLPYRKLLSRKS